ncbi:hypothetical protein MMC15_001858 [Xylographa vitiligo]|nr:hypothetical protein [Xylographa vitiligo]
MASFAPPPPPQMKRGFDSNITGLIVPFILAARVFENDPDPFSSQLFCPEALPLGKYGNPSANRAFRNTYEILGHQWYGWSFHNFTSLADLCAATGNEKANMGGRVRPLAIPSPALPDPDLIL